MTYTAEHAYLTFGGSLAGGEQWQCGLRYQKYGTPGGLWADAFADIGLDDILADLQSWFSSSDTLFANTHTLAWAKIASIGTDGHYSLDPRLVEDSSPATGYQGSYLEPNQVATCITLRSGEQFGRANRGRIFAPAIQQTVESADARLPVATVQAFAARTNTMLEAVAGEMSTVLQPLRLAIFSAVGTGTTKPVVSIDVGTVPDTQRRRRNALVEEFQNVAYTP